MEAIEAALALPAQMRAAMMNVFERFSTPAGDKEPGRLTYQRYARSDVSAHSDHKPT
ncbi:MAG: hypothetical protein AAGH57_08315 [Pseudomonadota bacterium]